MEQQSGTQTSDPTALVTDYLQAVKDRDLDKCLGFYADDATLIFLSGVFRGKKAISDWHKERFDALFEIIRVESMRAKDDRVTIDAVITSKRLKTWKINSLGGRANFRVDQGKIREVKLSPRIQNPFEGKEGQGREGKGREGQGREGREGQGREGR